jgi:flagellar basal-body rod protein FlgF
VTQFASPFGVTNIQQDGYTAGQLVSIAAESNGIVTARYSNGQTKPAGQIEIANFRNMQGLQPIGNNMWVKTYASGDPVVGVPGEGNLGVLQSGALEESNVDLTAELVNMITAQRTYQANAQTIKTRTRCCRPWSTCAEPGLRHGPLVYLSMSGAKASLQRQEVLANNLANASTNGFRAEMAAFRAVPVQGDGASTRAFALETTIGYTTSARVPCSHRTRSRRGDGGQAPGWPCRGWTAPRPTHAPARCRSTPRATGHRDRPARAGRRRHHHHPAGAQVSIAADGTVNTTVGNGRPQQAGRLKLVTPEGRLQRGGDGLFRAADGNDLPADPEGRVQGGALEGSNVSPVETMVAMIAAARQFEQQMKSLQTAEQREQAASGCSRHSSATAAPRSRRSRAAIAPQSRPGSARRPAAPDRRTKPPLFRPPRPSGRGEDGPVTPGGPS